MYRDYGEYGTAWGHQLLPAPLWKQYEAASCATTFPSSETCNEITAQMEKILSGFDMYALDFPTCTSPVWFVLRILRRKEVVPHADSEFVASLK